MELYFQKLGDRLVEACEGAGQDALILIAAPFIKKDALERILAHCTSGQQIQVITRWHLDEIAAGASDPEIWELLRTHSGASLWLRSNLHAKYYRFGSICYVGSANVTDSALGWRSKPNFELLVPVDSIGSEAMRFEKELKKSCVEVSQDLYDQLAQLREEYAQLDHYASIDQVKFNAAEADDLLSEPDIEFGVSESEHIDRERWVPHLRHPEELYQAYTGNLDPLTAATQRHSLRDLRFLNIPGGLPKEAFHEEVKWQLLQMPVVQKIDNYVQVSRRFGAVRDYLKTLPCAEEPGFNATEAWQTLMRWLLYFFEDRYDRQVANYSEIFVRRG